jgi:GTP-binding protein EngB required for normal cell division
MSTPEKYYEKEDDENEILHPRSSSSSQLPTHSQSGRISPKSNTSEESRVRQFSESFTQDREDLKNKLRLAAVASNNLSGPKSVTSKSWHGFEEFPNPTQAAIRSMIESLKHRPLYCSHPPTDETSHTSTSGKTPQLRIMMLGKTGVGKSSTINSILNEKNASPVGALTANATNSVIEFTRTILGFELKLIDTPGLLEKDNVSETSLRKIETYLAHPENGLDIVMFFERMDMYHIEPIDRRVVEAVTKHLGKDIWRRTILVVTRSSALNYQEGIARVQLLTEMMRQTSRHYTRSVALVENLMDRVDSEGQPILPDGTAWVPNLFALLSETCHNLTNQVKSDFRYHPNHIKRLGSKFREMSLISLIITAQYTLKVSVLDRIMLEDGLTGDSNGIYDSEKISRNRENEKRNKIRKRQQLELTKMKTNMSSLQDSLEHSM